jgi:hypothetical protein
VKLHKPIEVVVDLVEAVFHTRKAILHLFYDRGVARLE